MKLQSKLIRFVFILGLISAPALANAEEMKPAVDVKIELTKLDSQINTKEREIAFYRAELMALEIGPQPEHVRRSERQRLRLAIEVLESEIEDIRTEKAKLLNAAEKRTGATQLTYRYSR